MQIDRFQEMLEFIVRAKANTYVGGGQKQPPYRLGSHDLQYMEGDWVYHDSYLGENDFIGEEAVYYRGKVIWGMNYFGRILRPERITSSQAGQVIQQSLSQMYKEGRFLGGFKYPLGEFTYIDTNNGDMTFFTGREFITRDNEVVYELVYHGGIVKE